MGISGASRARRERGRAERVLGQSAPSRFKPKQKDYTSNDRGGSGPPAGTPGAARPGAAGAARGRGEAGARRGGEGGEPRGGRGPEEGRTRPIRPPARPRRAEPSLEARAGRDLSLPQRRKRVEARAKLRLALAGARAIVDMSYSRHFLDFQGSAIPRTMQKLVVTRLSPNLREAVTLRRDCPVPLPGDGDLLVRNR